MELTVRLSVGEAAFGWRELGAATRCEGDSKITFGRHDGCDLIIPREQESFLQFSRVHGHFYGEFPNWRVRSEGSSELRMWLDFGIDGVVTGHGPGSDVRLPVNEGTITFRPSGTKRDVRLQWAYSNASMPGGSAQVDRDRTIKPQTALHLPSQMMTARFQVFLLILCHQPLLRLGYTAPTIKELALWMSSRRGTKMSAEAVRKDYVGRLRTHLQSTPGSRTFAHYERAGTMRHHAELAMLAQDAMDTGLTCDDLIECIRSGRMPNFPDLGWREGRRG